MNTNEHKYAVKKKPLLTEIIIGCALKVHNTLGAGYLEKVYENALLHELIKLGFKVEQQKYIPVKYDGIIVGDFVADLIVEDKVIIELKVCSGLSNEITAICLNYLKTTQAPVCLPINFAKPRLEWKRLVGESYIKEITPI